GVLVLSIVSISVAAKNDPPVLVELRFVTEFVFQQPAPSRPKHGAAILVIQGLVIVELQDVSISPDPVERDSAGVDFRWRRNDSLEPREVPARAESKIILLDNRCPSLAGWTKREVIGAP